MYQAACFIAAMFIAQSILLPASITTTTSGQMTDPLNAVLASCADAGQTSSTCTAILQAHPPATLGGNAQASISGDWNIVSSRTETALDLCCAFPASSATARATWTVNDTITIHGSAGPAFLLMEFWGYNFDYQSRVYTLFVNGQNRDMDPGGRANNQPLYPPGIVPAGGFVVPFVFDLPFPLTFGFEASGISAGDTNITSGGAALFPGQVFRTYDGAALSDRIGDFDIVRESGASFGVPEPGTLMIFAAALAFAGLARLTRRSN